MPDAGSESSASTSSTVGDSAASPVASPDTSPVAAPTNDTYNSVTNSETSPVGSKAAQQSEESTDSRKSGEEPQNTNSKEETFSNLAEVNRLVDSNKLTLLNIQELNQKGYLFSKKFEEEYLKKKVGIPRPAEKYRGVTMRGEEKNGDRTDWVYLTSSFISAARCANDSITISVKFKKIGKTSNYEFKSPEEARQIFTEFVESASPGRYYNENIKHSRPSGPKERPRAKVIAKKEETYRTRSDFGTNEPIQEQKEIKPKKKQNESQAANIVSNLADAGELALTVGSVLGKISGGYGAVGYLITGLAKHFAQTRGGKSNKTLDLATRVTLGAQVGLTIAGAITSTSGKAKFAGQVWAKTPFGKAGISKDKWSIRSTADQVGKAATVAARYAFQESYIFAKTRRVEAFTHEIPSGTQLFGKTFDTYKVSPETFRNRATGLAKFYRNHVKVDPALQRWTRGIGLATGAGVALFMQKKETRIALAPYIGATLTAGITGYGLYKTKTFKNIMSNVAKYHKKWR